MPSLSTPLRPLFLAAVLGLCALGAQAESDPAADAPPSDHARVGQPAPDAAAPPEAAGLPRLSPRQAAVFDSLSTHLAISAGGVETNPLVTPSPLGLIALIGFKLGLIEYADTLPPAQRQRFNQTSSAFWGGASVNNLLVAASAHPLVAVGAGILSGAYFWNRAGQAAQPAVDPEAVIGLYRGANGTPGALVLARDGSFGIGGEPIAGLGRGGQWRSTARGVELRGDAGTLLASPDSGAMILRSAQGQSFFVR